VEEDRGARNRRYRERERERELERCKKDETLSIEHTSLLSKAGNPNPNPWELANLGPAVSWRSC